MKEIRVKAEGYNLIVVDDTPVNTSFRISHTEYKCANVHYWGTSKTKLLALETEPKYEVADDARISVVNPIVSIWCNGLTKWGGYNSEVVEKANLYKDSVYDTDLNKRQIFINESAIELNNGKYLIKDFGKYGSHLLIISNKPVVTFDKSTANIGGTELKEVKGTFFTTKKGAKAFDTTTTSPTHILYKDGWGGAFNSYRGNKLIEGLYNYRAHSNGGGAGYDYAVYKLGDIPRPSIEDF